MSSPRILINALSVTDGGGRTYIRNLLRELGEDPRGYRISVLVASGQLALAEAEGVETVPVRLPAVPGAARALLRVAYEEALLPARARGFDLLYCIADLCPALAATPTVVALRNLNVYDRRYFDDLRVRSLEKLVRIGLRRVRRVVFPTRAAAELVRRRIPIPEQRIRVVPHGIAPEIFEAASKPPEAAAPYLFLPAAVEPHKNIEVVIEALALLGDSRLEAWIAGTTRTQPGYADRMRALAERRGVAARVRFLGPLRYEEVLGYHRGAAALVFPSYLESFGHPLLEAMLAGTPIVASDIPALREVAGDVARYFPPENAAALATAIEATLTDREGTRARVERGGARAAEFSWKRSVDLLCRVFDEVLRG